MALNTYSALQGAVADWLVRADLTGRIPDFIRLAEAYLEHEPRLHVSAAEATASLTSPTAGVYTLPADFGYWRQVADGSTVLEPVPIDFAVARMADAAETIAFTVSGLSLTTYAPASGTLSLKYFRKIPPLSDAAPTNWALTLWPHAYLYATLVQAALFVDASDGKPGPVLGYYTKLLETSLDRIASADFSGRWTGAVIRTESARP